ncbi:MAG: HlyD family efflux transporter periplasmic adaptor subunit [Planctomycetales bacterium]|nr:HlyD family efflux transporter periplasmic adaptor subunit [Planctomycetales bacterium]
MQSRKCSDVGTRLSKVRLTFLPSSPEVRYMCAQLAVPLVILIGCAPPSSTDREAQPRPVSVRTLSLQRPPDESLVSASVASWKTEPIGFEVGGRVEFVVEPNTEIEGRVFNRDGELAVAGTPIARIESERYQLQVEKAEADVARAEQTLAASTIQLEEGLPAQLAAAEATKDLAETEYQRSRDLARQNAVAQSEVDRNKASLQNAISEVKRLESVKKATEAEVESNRSALKQAQQLLRDAQRDLDDCTLYASFNGQIANVSAVPGSFVTAGQSVATIQMMNPIKVELEVSADDSRRLLKTDRLPVFVNLPDGEVSKRDGFLYLIDSIADPLTRTFTITLLVMNEKVGQPVFEPTTPTINHVWRLDYKFLPGAEEGKLYVVEDAIHQDEAGGDYVWMATNMIVSSGLPDDRVIQVRKLPVSLGRANFPFLGNWLFQEVTIDDEQFDPAANLVVGKLHLGEGDPANWQGDTVVYDNGGQWVLRPGDLVQVALSTGANDEGYYVPMDAVAREGDSAHLFIADDSGESSVARRIPIHVVADQASTSAMLKILPVESLSLDGVRYVTQGAHYLVDGEPIVVVAESLP